MHYSNFNQPCFHIFILAYFNIFLFFNSFIHAFIIVFFEFLMKDRFNLLSQSLYYCNFLELISIFLVTILSLHWLVLTEPVSIWKVCCGF